MQHPWWTRKPVFGLGLLGALIWLIIPTIGSIIWPVFKPLQYTMALLTANDAMYASTFRSLEIIGALLLIIFLLALWRFFVYDNKTDLVKATRYLIVSVGLYFIGSVGYPITAMADIVVPSGRLSGHVVFDTLMTFLLGGTLWYFGRSAKKTRLYSLANMVQLAASLYALFKILEVIVFYLGWPLQGLMSQLALYVLMLGLAYISWYFMRQAA